jgi:hypothetical protein
MNEPILVPSPDKRRKAVLSFLGKIQSGREYYSLAIEGIPLSLQNRVFGRICLWSHDSRFLAIQEWKENDAVTGPKSYVLSIFDLLARRECIVAEVEGTKCEINPQEFMGDSLMYTVFYEGQFGITKNFETNFQYLTGWWELK